MLEIKAPVGKRAHVNGWEGAGGPQHPGQRVPSLCARELLLGALCSSRAPHAGCTCILSSILTREPGASASGPALWPASFTKFILGLFLVEM